MHLQGKLLIPFGVKLLRHGLGPLLGLSNLDGDIGVAGAGLVLGDEPLGAHHWGGGVRPGNQPPMECSSHLNFAIFPQGPT